MAGEWRMHALGEFVDLQRGHDFLRAGSDAARAMVPDHCCFPCGVRTASTSTAFAKASAVSSSARSGVGLNGVNVHVLHLTGLSGRSATTASEVTDVSCANESSSAFGLSTSSSPLSSPRLRYSRSCIPRRRCNTQLRSSDHRDPPFRHSSRTTRHRPHPRHAGRQDRAEPAHERDPGGDGPRPVQVVVRGLRPGARQGGGAGHGAAARDRRSVPGWVRGVGGGGGAEGVARLDALWMTVLDLIEWLRLPSTTSASRQVRDAYHQVRALERWLSAIDPVLLRPRCTEMLVGSASIILLVLHPTLAVLLRLGVTVQTAG